MKLLKLSSLIMLAFALMSFTSNECILLNADSSNFNFYSSVKWKSSEIDLGEIKQNVPVTIEFEFTNTSNADIIVMDAQASCGCTIADFPKQPIAAGKSGKITATYNAAALGAFTKAVTVRIQNEEAKVLNFKGIVR